MKNEDRLPKWMSFALVMTVIILVMVIGYVWHHTQEESTPNPIGKYNDRKMTEKIDQDNDNGIIGLDRR